MRIQAQVLVAAVVGCASVNRQLAGAAPVDAASSTDFENRLCAEMVNALFGKGKFFAYSFFVVFPTSDAIVVDIASHGACANSFLCGERTCRLSTLETDCQLTLVCDTLRNTSTSISLSLSAKELRVQRRVLCAQRVPLTVQILARAGWATPTTVTSRYLMHEKTFPLVKEARNRRQLFAQAVCLFVGQVARQYTTTCAQECASIGYKCIATYDDLSGQVSECVVSRNATLLTTLMYVV